MSQTTEQYFDSLSTSAFNGVTSTEFNVVLSGSGNDTISGFAVLDYLSTKGIYLTPEQFEANKFTIQNALSMATFKLLSAIQLEQRIKL